MKRPPNKVGVLLMAYGAAASLENIPAYLQDILGGRPASERLIRDVTERYRLIGGKSPLLDITRAQARALGERLGLEVFVGMRHSEPTIRFAAEEASRAGCTALVALPLTPYQSRMSVGAYMQKAREAAGALEILEAGPWNEHPGLIEAFACKLRAAGDAAVILSAHSLPARIVCEGDPYPAQLKATAERVARAAGLQDWRFAYQSRGASGSEEWLGPDVSEVLGELARAGRKSVLLAPIGFVSDHLETLYDDDILYRGQAEALGMRFERAAALNADPAFIRVLADVVRARLESA